jgi:hypothetical protein
MIIILSIKWQRRKEGGFLPIHAQQPPAPDARAEPPRVHAQHVQVLWLLL